MPKRLACKELEAAILDAMLEGANIQNQSSRRNVREAELRVGGGGWLLPRVRAMSPDISGLLIVQVPTLP